MGVRRSHMVTRGYLSAWANEKNVIDVLDLQLGKGYPSSVENASVSSYVYDPEVLTHDLEGAYASIEGKGVSVLNKLRAADQPELTLNEQGDLITFLDMHLDRGRYADRAGVRVPAVLVKTDGTANDTDLRLGDMLLLGQYVKDVLRLASLGLESWTWRVRAFEAGAPLATGDGAVLLWRNKTETAPSTITFPISPRKLLVIGEELPRYEHLNLFIAQNCRRWMFGVRGTLNLAEAANLASQHRARIATARG